MKVVIFFKKDAFLKQTSKKKHNTYLSHQVFCCTVEVEALLGQTVGYLSASYKEGSGLVEALGKGGQCSFMYMFNNIQTPVTMAVYFT